MSLSPQKDSTLMDKAEFDAVALDYERQHASSIRFSGEETGFFSEYKAVDTRRTVDAAHRHPSDILDFGSGIGNAVAPLRRQFPAARLTCLDVSEESLNLSRSCNGDAASYCVYDGRQIPRDIGAFDLIYTACVFHHIPAEQHVDLLRQLKGLLRPGGIFILFEHNPWNPVTRYVVKNCPFDENAVLITAPTMRSRVRAAGFEKCAIRYRLFFPKGLAFLRPTERFLAALPLGAQYFLSAR
jgi:SAM-dependent methyltransferase